jgi:hypothetical protein
LSNPDRSNTHQITDNDRKSPCDGNLPAIDHDAASLKGAWAKELPLEDRLLTIDPLFPFCVTGPRSNFAELYVSPASIFVSIQGQVHDYLVFFRPNKGRLVITCPSPQFLDIFLDHFRQFPFAELFCRQTSTAPFDLVITPISLDEATNLGNVDFRWSQYLAQARGGFPNPFLMDLGIRGQKWADIFRSHFNSDFAGIFPPFFLTPHVLEAIAWALRFDAFWKALLDCFQTYHTEIHGINLIRINSAYCNPEPYVKGNLDFCKSPKLRFNAEKHLANTRRLLAIGLDCLVYYYTGNWSSQSFWKLLAWAKELGYTHHSPACQEIQFQHSLSRFDEFGPSWGL